MSYFPGDSEIFGRLFNDERITELFSDTRYISTLVEVEIALAKVQGELGVIPGDAAERIEAQTASFQPDLIRLGEVTAQQGFPVVGLIQQLREHIGEEAASFVHWGATTQDIIDTALILRIKHALTVIEEGLSSIINQLSELADVHRDTLMVARTHLQHALPTTFGYKVATWLTPLLRHRDRLVELRPRVLVVQLGGGAGTLASLGDQGTTVQKALAAELDLGIPLLPWHTQRDSLAEFAGWLSLVTGSLGKLALDVILLSQTEIGEVAESGNPDYGSSSTMPQKKNPIRSEAILMSAQQNATLLGGLHQSLQQEHERGTHGWQLEWMTLPQMVGLTSGALRNATTVIGEIQVNVERMRQNVEKSNGVLLAEPACLLLSQVIPRKEATAVVKKAIKIARVEEKHLIDVLREIVDLDCDWSKLPAESNYLGAVKTFTERIIRAANQT